MTAPANRPPSAEAVWCPDDLSSELGEAEALLRRRVDRIHGGYQRSGQSRPPRTTRDIDWPRSGSGCVTPSLWVPIHHPCWSSGMFVRVESAAEPIFSADVQTRDLPWFGDRFGQRAEGSGLTQGPVRPMPDRLRLPTCSDDVPSPTAGARAAMAHRWRHGVTQRGSTTRPGLGSPHGLHSVTTVSPDLKSSAAAAKATMAALRHRRVGTRIRTGRTALTSPAITSRRHGRCRPRTWTRAEWHRPRPRGVHHGVARHEVQRLCAPAAGRPSQETRAATAPAVAPKRPRCFCPLHRSVHPVTLRSGNAPRSADGGDFRLSRRAGRQCGRA